MKRLFALLLLAVSPAFAQEQPVIYDPVVQQTYTLQQTPTTSLDNVNQTGGTALTLYDDGTTFTPIELPFDFYYFGNLYDSVYVSQNGFISFTSNANGCCGGEVLPFLSQNSYYNMNNSIFGMWSDLADFNTPGNPYYQTFADRFTVGWYGVDELGTANKFTYEITLFDNSNFSIAYSNFDYAGPTGRTFTSGFQGDTSNEFWQLYNGNDPTILENKTYLFVSSEITPPPPPPEEPPPVIAPDCNINPNDPTCIINALIPDATDEEFLADTGFDNGSDNGSEPVIEEDPVQEEMLADMDLMQEESFIEEPVEEQSLEEMLAADDDTEELAAEELVADAKEMVNEEKAATLADSISKDVLEAALSIAADATASGSSVESGSSDSSKTSSVSMTASVTETTTTETAIAAVEMSSESSKEEMQSESSSVAALDILETGRQLGQDALAVTLAGTEASALESLNEAESIAAVSSFDSVSASAESITQTENDINLNLIEFALIDETPEQQIISDLTNTDNAVALTTDTITENTDNQIIEMTIAEETVVENNEVQVAETTEETVETFVAEAIEDTSQQIQSEEMMLAESPAPQQIQETIVETQTEEFIVADTTTIETAIESNEVEQVFEVQTEQQSAIEFTTVDQAMEIFANNIDQQYNATEQEELENSVVQQAIASSQIEDDNKMGFAEAEAMTIASDPALANAFNVQPNTASLELLGVLGSRAEEKSDAELRAEQVVAANKEEQDAINANYMEADQSGILAAIGSETDVSAYRNAMLRDASAWYKPEDIYKGVIIKDNVRGSYFLEKGNTDTYKKMIEEQYKDE